MESDTVPSLTSNPFILQQASLLNSANVLQTIASGAKGTLRGKIVSVDDPEQRGRVKVIFDDMNPKKPQSENAGVYGEDRQGDGAESHWVDATPAFKGKQPKSLVGKRVNISATDGQYQYAVIQDVLWDEGILNEDTAPPTNSTMTRLPVYNPGELPPACEENHGCMVIEAGGPMNSDWLCVCLRRQGKYIWVRHVDLQHGHAGENDGQQPNDSHGDGEQPVAEQSVWDYVFPTSLKAMPKTSAYGTSPRSNPYGGQATWHAPPK